MITLHAPGYWMSETSGALRPAIEAYLSHDELTPEQIAAIRAYLRQWIEAPGWRGGMALDDLRRDVDGLTNRAAVDRWLHYANLVGIDPL